MPANTQKSAGAESVKFRERKKKTCPTIHWERRERGQLLYQGRSMHACMKKGKKGKERSIPCARKGGKKECDRPCAS